MDIERRFTKFEDSAIECREDGENKQISGYGVVFYDGTAGTEYNLFGDYYERMDRHAFDDVLERSDVVGAFNHDMSLILGRTTSGTMKLSVDERGIKYNITLPNTSLGNDIKELITRGDITGSSVAFAPESIEWETETRGANSVRVRNIKKVKLMRDIGPVTDPAYQATSVNTRSKEEIEKEFNEETRSDDDVNLQLEKDKRDRDLQLTKLKCKEYQA